MTYKKFVPGRWKIGQGSLCPPPPVRLTANTWLAGRPERERTTPLKWWIPENWIIKYWKHTKFFTLRERLQKFWESISTFKQHSSGNCWKIETKLKCVVKTDWKMSNNDILIGNKLILSCWERELTTFIFHCLKSEICLRSWKHFKYGSVGVDFIPRLTITTSPPAWVNVAAGAEIEIIYQLRQF